jgi:hypothetical protein
MGTTSLWQESRTTRAPSPACGLRSRAVREAEPSEALAANDRHRARSPRHEHEEALSTADRRSQHLEPSRYVGAARIVPHSGA